MPDTTPNPPSSNPDPEPQASPDPQPAPDPSPSAEIGVKPLTPVPPAQPEDRPMLDVHAPHESVHSFKDALIHIAIIVVGLLIAVALDETAEHIHHMRQVAETREALNQELEYNIKLFQQTTKDTRYETAEYKNDMLVFEYLQKHPGTPQQKLPGILLWQHGDNRYRYAAWETAQQSGITALMPQDIVAHAATMYHDLHHAEDMAEQEYSASHDAEAYIYQDYDPSHLASAEVTKEIELMRTVLMWHYRYVLALALIAQRDPGFTNGPTSADERQLSNTPDAQTQKLLAPAIALSLDRLKPLSTQASVGGASSAARAVPPPKMTTPAKK
jgi:hypothetical protein